MHFSPKRGYKVQIDVFVLQKYKTTLIFRLVAMKFLSRITLFSCQFWILQKPLVSKFSLLSCLVNPATFPPKKNLKKSFGTSQEQHLHLAHTTNFPLTPITNLSRPEPGSSRSADCLTPITDLSAGRHHQDESLRMWGLK